MQVSTHYPFRVVSRVSRAIPKNGVTKNRKNGRMGEWENGVMGEWGQENGEWGQVYTFHFSLVENGGEWGQVYTFHFSLAPGWRGG